MDVGNEACEAVLAVGLVLGFLLLAHVVVLMDMERVRRGRRRRRR